MRRYLRGERIDVQAVAAELSLGRTTIYRWFGSRENLIGEVLVTAAGPLLEKVRGFLFNDAVVGIRCDVERLREVDAVLLGVASRQLRRTQ
jgi:AcrR family transcriptional regulator